MIATCKMCAGTGREDAAQLCRACQTCELGVYLIGKERQRQRTQEGWKPTHDDIHADESLACAAACYAMPERFRSTRRRGLWRWATKWWKPSPENRTRELVKAGALIAAELDRIARATGGA